MAVSSALTDPTGAHRTARVPAAKPRFGGLFWRLARATSWATMPLAGKRWNPIFSVVEHRGRKTGRRFATPIAARRVADGFVIALAFGVQVDWYRNLMAAGGGTLRWRGRAYPVTEPQTIDASTALAAFLPVQRAALRAAGVDGFVRVGDRARVDA